MFKILGNEFKQSEQDTSVTVELVWGIKGVDTSKTSRFDPTNRGELIWDTNFKIYSPEAQV